MMSHNEDPEQAPTRRGPPYAEFAYFFATKLKVICFLLVVKMFPLLVLLLITDLCKADYSCLCSYNVEKPVLDSVCQNNKLISHVIRKLMNKQ